MTQPSRTLRLSGFDPAGEPEVQVMPDGSLCLLCEFMPPSDFRDDEEAFFARFDQELGQALDVPVLWEDRERFLIAAPRADTLERLTRFVRECRKRGGASSRSGTKPGVRAALHEALGELLIPAGFRLRKGEEGFAKAIPSGRQLLLVVLWGYPPADHSFGLVCCTELAAVAALLRPFGGGGSVLTQLEHFGLEPVRPYGVQFPIESSDRVRQAVAQAAPVITGQILPFFERHRDVAALDRALHGDLDPNRRRSRGWWDLFKGARPRPGPALSDEWLARRQALDSSGPPYREMAALAIAHLAQNARFEELVTRYRGGLGGLQAVDGQRFEGLVAHLRVMRGATSP